MKQEIKFNKKTYLPFIGLNDPEHPQNHGKKFFEVKIEKLSDGTMKKGIWIDGEYLDYSINVNDYFRACQMGYKKDVQENIIKHFVKSVSEFVGRKVTAQEIIEAHRTNWI